MIYELRVYEPAPGKLQALHRRFADITVGYFEKYDMKPMGFWTEEIGTSNKLIYMLGFENMAQREQAWDAFRADKDRAQAFAETESDGPLVARVTNTILKPTEYSAMR